MRPSRFRVIVAALFVGVAAVTFERAGAVTLPFTATAQQGVFLHISDIHFNPFADKSLLPALMAAPVDQWEKIFQRSQNKRLAPYGEDTNFPLLMSTLSAAKGTRYDYVLNTGDNLAHRFRSKFDDAKGDPGDYRKFVSKTLLFVDHMLKKSFPGVPLIYTFGNDDSVCGDYQLTPHSDMLAQVGRDLPLVASNPQALRDFEIGGFYIVPHPTVPRHDIIALTSIFWSVKYRNLCGSKDGDPGSAELDWLRRTLEREKRAGRTATLVMHIPPGINAFRSSQQACPQSTNFWRKAYTRRFLALAGAYQDVLRDSYAGHTHMDGFRVLSDQHGRPFLTTRITPAVSPVFGNNPAFTVLLYDRSDAIVRDYATFYLDLATAGPNKPAPWALEYAFAQAYKVQRYTPAQADALAKRIRTVPSVRASYTKYYPADSRPSPITAANWKAFACAQTALTPDAYATCRCAGSAPH